MRMSLTTLGMLLLPAALGAQTLTKEERHALLQSLQKTDQELSEIVQEITPAQWEYKPAADRWSIREVAEHILVSEQAFRNLITTQLMEGPAPTGDNSQDESAKISKFMNDRSQRFQAPDFALPTGRWPSQQAFLDAWEQTRGETMEFVEDTELDLHGHTLQHPAFGMIDGNEWLTAMTSHAERHLLQIREVMQSPGYPKTSSDYQ